MGTERVLVRSAKHTTALAARANVLTLLMGVKMFRHGDFLSDSRSNEVTRQRKTGKEKSGSLALLGDDTFFPCGWDGTLEPTPPHDFCKDVIRWGLRDKGLQKI